MRPLIFLGGCLLGLQLHFAAQAQSINPGSYLAEGGWGSLEIKPGKAGKFPFVLDTLGSNFHMCNAEGEISGTQAVLPDGDAEGKHCVLQFSWKNGAVTVSTNDQCRYYCGARASLDGEYFSAPSACTGNRPRTARKQFKALYDQKKYPQAAEKLQVVLQQCDKFLGKFEAGWLRNDLALAQFKMQLPEQCLQTLQPLREEAGKTDEQITEHYAPAEIETYLPIVKATRTNLKLCSKK